MIDQIDAIIKNYSPEIKNNQFYKMCYQVFLETEHGRVLMAHLFEEYVNRPFTDLMSRDPDIDPNKIMCRSIQRDLVQSLLLKAQLYEKFLKSNEGENNG